jgi:hypothetical protein
MGRGGCEDGNLAPFRRFTGAGGDMPQRLLALFAGQGLGDKETGQGRAISLIHTDQQEVKWLFGLLPHLRGPDLAAMANSLLDDTHDEL